MCWGHMGVGEVTIHFGPGEQRIHLLLQGIKSEFPIHPKGGWGGSSEGFN